MYYHCGKVEILVLLVLCSEVVLFSEVINVLSLWESGNFGATCPLFRGCHLFRVSTIGGSPVMVHLLSQS